jgi:hypothetical protein
MRRGAGLLVLLACACGESASGAGAPAGDDASDDASIEASAPTPCSLTPAGDAVPIVSFPDRHATAPTMVALDPGSADGAASIALQVFANAGTSGLPDDIEIARARVSQDWPRGAVLDQPPKLQGEFALGAALLAASPHDPRTLALAWHRDDAAVGRPQFRSIDPASWQQGPEVAIQPSGDAMFSFASGAGVGSDGSWTGDGFAIAWRHVSAPDVGPARPLAAILDVSGNLMRGPSPLATAEDFPGRSPALAWSGSTYLVATSYVDCFGGDACRPRSVVLQRLSAKAAPDMGLTLQPIASFSTVDPAALPGTPMMAAFQGRVWLVWSEGVPADASGERTRTIRLVATDEGGQPLGDPTTIDDAARPTTRVSVSAGDAGVLVAWAEDGPVMGDGGDANDVRIGASSVVVRRAGEDGRLDPAVRIPTTRVDDYGPPTTAAIASPRGALVLWAGRSTVPTQFDVTWLARLDCSAL